MSTASTILSARNRELIERARRGDESAFAGLVEPLRRELTAHCYRMMGSMHDAEDALQDTLLRAWRGLDRFEGRSSLKSWLYRIATNTCLNAIEKRPKKVLPMDLGGSNAPGEAPGEALMETPWLGPAPEDAFGLEDGLAAPDARFEARESVELAFVAAMQHLPGNQRAALIMREVLGFSAAETAESLETTTASVNSALQRARKLVDEKLPERSQTATLRALGDEKLRKIVEAYMEAMQRGDVNTVISLLTEDAAWSMPPLPGWFQGEAAIREFLIEFPGSVRWAHVPTTANGQLAFGCYRWEEEKGVFDAMVVDVLDLSEDGRIRSVTAFIDDSIFPMFGLPMTLPPTARVVP